MSTVELDVMEQQWRVLLRLEQLLDAILVKVATPPVIDVSPTFTPEIRLPAPQVTVPPPVVEVRGVDESVIDGLRAAMVEQDRHRAEEMRDLAELLRLSAGTSPAVSVAPVVNKLDELLGRVSDETGTWGYYAGAAGTVNVAAGERVVGIAASATSAGATVAVAGGAALPVPANQGADIEPKGNLVGPVAIVFSGTASYFVEVLR